MSLNIRHNLIKSIQANLPRGSPFDLETLEKHEVSAQLAAKYVKSGWLVRLAQGIYAFPSDTLDLHLTVRFLQGRVEGLHIAGKSALALQGVRHNLAMRDKTILWGNTRFKLPEWFTVHFPAHYVAAHLFTWPDPALAEKSITNPPGLATGLCVSTPERALLELLYEVGTHQGMEEAYNLFSGVRNLRSHILGPLLECCTNIKTTRLLLTWGRDTGVIDTTTLQQSYHLSVGSEKRWMRHLNDGSLLSLKPYG